MTVSRWIILIMRNISTECVKKIKTHVENPFSRKSCLLWNNVGKYGKLRHATDNIIRRMRFACCLTKATDTHSEYVILIAFPEQLWFRERTSMLRLYVHCLSFSYLYVHCLSCSYLYVHCLSCSYLYIHCLSCSYLYVHCPVHIYMYIVFPVHIIRTLSVLFISPFLSSRSCQFSSGTSVKKMKLLLKARWNSYLFPLKALN
jgi:hypothetical protein